MTSKVKIKAVISLYGVTGGAVYHADIVGDRYRFINNYGVPDLAHKSHFVLIADEPAIEVGSEWVSQNNVTWKVVYAGKSVVVVRGNTENTLRREKFLEKYKPKPKTVTMYFYYIGKHLCANDYMPHGYTQAFTREIELP